MFLSANAIRLVQASVCLLPATHLTAYVQCFQTSISDSLGQIYNGSEEKKNSDKKKK